LKTFSWGPDLEKRGKLHGEGKQAFLPLSKRREIGLHSDVGVQYILDK